MAAGLYTFQVSPFSAVCTQVTLLLLVTRIRFVSAVGRSIRFVSTISQAIRFVSTVGQAIRFVSTVGQAVHFRWSSGRTDRHTGGPADAPTDACHYLPVPVSVQVSARITLYRFSQGAGKVYRFLFLIQLFYGNHGSTVVGKHRRGKVCGLW